MFREFNVKFEDVEMLGGADNILEGTEVTKVIMRGHNKMSSLNSALKNCKELDIVDGELDLNGVESINEILEDTPLVKKIDIKNVNNENITTKNAFNNIGEIGIGGDLYNKKALQNVLASKDWTFEGFEYKDEVENNITTKEVNVVDNNKITIQDTLEQKAKGIEIEGQTYENLINGEGEINLIDELTIESIDGKKEFDTDKEQEVCVEVIEGETYQNLVDGKGEHKLTDIFSTTWTESNNSIDNAPSVIEVPEIWGNTIQDETDLSNIQSVGDLYVDENGEAILDEEGNEQYKLEISSDYKPISDFIIAENNIGNTNGWSVSIKVKKKKGSPIIVKYKKNTSNPLRIGFKLGIDDTFRQFSIEPGDKVIGKLYTLIFDEQDVLDCEEFLLRTINNTVNTFKNLFTSKQYEIFLSLNEDDESNKTTILMPCQLSRIISSEYNGSYLTECDKLYYDISSNKYLIEKNISEYTTPNINYQGELNVKLNLPSDMVNSNNNYDNYPFIIQDAKVRGWSRPTDSCFGVKRYNKDTHVRLATSNTFTNEEVSSFLSNKKILYITSSPQVIETEILEKLSLETYSPKTYISTNSEVQPSQMSIVNKQTILSPLSLQANTDYTLQLDSTGKDDKPITVNLGGTETTIQPTNDTSKHHKVVVRTPATLSNDTLELSGEGVIVNDVMLFQGGSNVIKQDVSYIDGIESIGELQGDGTYKIDILTSNSKKNPNASYCEYDVSPFKTSFNTSSIKDITVEFAVEDLSDANIIKDSRGARLYIEDTRLMIETFSFDEGFGTYTIGDVTTNDLICLAYENQDTAKVYVNGVLKLTKKTAPSGVIETLCKLKYLSIFTYKLDQSDLSVTLPSRSSATIYLPQLLRKINNKADKLYWDRNKEYYCIEKNVDDNYEVLNDNIIIDLPNLNKKYVLNSYNPKTYIEFSNLNLKPSRLLLESNIHKYDVVELKTNEKYTMQFNCIEKSDNPIKLDLDGIAKNVNPTLGLNHIEISTGSISDNLLKLSGSGNKISDIMVVEGDMKQYPEYFDGIQSVGVLENGKYRIDIKTNEGFNISIKTDSPLKKNDKLYWNNSNKRYEIDRNGEIEIPIVEGEVIDLPRLYQIETANIKIETGNIKPSKIKIEYLDIN